MTQLSSGKKACKLLDGLLDQHLYPPDFQIVFVLSYPRSDMGKGTLVAHLLSHYHESDAIKFDGLLNTNANGRHTARGHDDFGTYEKYNSNKLFGDEHYLLGGHLFLEFIQKYGEMENLTFRPYFAKYFINKIYETWRNTGAARILFVEIGGTITDWEVDPYITPVINYFKSKHNSRCKILVLSEIDYNNHYVKTKTTQLAVAELLKRMVIPDYILVREPMELNLKPDKPRGEIELCVEQKLLEVFGIDFSKKVTSIPFYKQKDIDQLGSYLENNFFNRLHL